MKFIKKLVIIISIFLFLLPMFLPLFPLTNIMFNGDKKLINPNENPSKLPDKEEISVKDVEIQTEHNISGTGNMLLAKKYCQIQDGSTDLRHPGSRS